MVRWCWKTPSSPATAQRHELVKEAVAHASPQPRRRIDVPSKIERDEAGYTREVAQLNAQNDPHAIPTIDPSARQSSSKSYALQIPESARGDEHGNGIITPTRAWSDSGRNCYYARYEFTYPSGSTENGDIVWPLCFDQTADPFKEPSRPIPFGQWQPPGPPAACVPACRLAGILLRFIKEETRCPNPHLVLRLRTGVARRS